MGLRVSPLGPTPRPVLDRIADHTIIDEETGCHLWTGALAEPDGRPTIATGSKADGSRRLRHVHRVVWGEHHGDPPEGFDVHHRCEEIHCVNIAHLELLTHGDHSSHHRRKEGWQSGYPLHVRWHVNRGIVNSDCDYC
jgi:hypothetical protein